MIGFDEVINFLNAPSDARAFGLGIVGSMALTQVAKFAFPDYWSDVKHRLITMLLAFGSGSVFTYALWPAGDAGRAGMALIVGLIAPIAYPLITGIVYRFFPWLEPILSARPENKP